jgi:low affinity Fe/Cu permease
MQLPEEEQSQATSAQAEPVEPQAIKAPKSEDGQGTGSVVDAFHRMAFATAEKMGSPWAFVAALVVILFWASTGPLFKFGDTWQLVINTGTTIITFLMVFLIQSSQNRDSRAIHLKLDELIRTSRARNAFADLENATDRELDTFAAEFKALRKSGIAAPDAAVRARKRAHRKHNA